MTTAPCNPFFEGWRLTIGWPCYIICCLLAALGLRLLHSFWRALAVQKGDFPHDRDREAFVVIKEFGRAFRYCFWGNNECKEHSDLWLPFFIGAFELAAYPILLALGQLVVIGGWLGIKTAGGWLGWQASRTSFNRFLLFNLFNLALSYFWLSHYVQRLPCAQP